MYTSKEKLLEDLREYNAKGVCKVLPKECSKELLSDKNIIFEYIMEEGCLAPEFVEYVDTTIFA